MYYVYEMKTCDGVYDYACCGSVCRSPQGLGLGSKALVSPPELEPLSQHDGSEE